MNDRWLSVDETTNPLGVARHHLQPGNFRAMPAHKVGRFWRFKQHDVDAWVRDGGAAANSDDLD